MRAKRSLHPDVIGLAVIAAVAATWLNARAPQGRDNRPAIQVAQEEFGEPIGEDDAPVGGPMVGGEAVQDGGEGEAVGGAMVGGEAVQDGDEGEPIGGPMVGGEAVQDGGEGEPIGGPMVGGEAVQDGGEGEPVGGDTLY
jgi:hypothetical protein